MQIVGLPSAKSTKPAAEQDKPEEVTFVGSVRTELEQAARLNTVLGQQALVLAEQVVSPMNTGAMIAALSKEFRTVMAAAMEGANVAKDPITLLQEEWKERLERRRLSG